MIPVNYKTGWVEPGNNHCVIIYQHNESKRVGKMVSFYEAVRRTLNNQPIVDRDVLGEKYISTIKQGDKFLIDVDKAWFEQNQNLPIELSKKLYIVRKFSLSGESITIVLCKHNLANVELNKAKAPDVIRVSPNTLKGVQVTHDRVGQLIFQSEV